MNNTISITYDKSPKDLTALTSFEFNKDENVLQMKVGYVGSNADEIIKIVTEQGYIDRIKANVKEDTIEECIEIIKDTSRRNCSHILDEIVYRAVEQMENLKEEK